MVLEYNIIFPTIEKTDRKPCSIREQIIGIVMVSKRDFDNVTCIWSCNVYTLWRLPRNVTYVWSTKFFHSFAVFCRKLSVFYK